MATTVSPNRSPASVADTPCVDRCERQYATEPAGIANVVAVTWPDPTPPRGPGAEPEGPRGASAPGKKVWVGPGGADLVAEVKVVRAGIVIVPGEVGEP